MFNKIIMLGNLSRDVEVRYSQASLAISNTAIATSRKFKSPSGEQKEEVCFTDITFFGRSAEVANQYLRKGSKILIEGRLVFEQWSDQNGQKRSKHSIAVETMQMLDSKSDATAAAPNQAHAHESYANNKEASNTMPKPYVQERMPSPTPIELDDFEEPPF